jgi:hypothetical protein
MHCCSLNSEKEVTFYNLLRNPSLEHRQISSRRIINSKYADQDRPSEKPLRFIAAVALQELHFGTGTVLRRNYEPFFTSLADHIMKHFQVS